MTYIDVSQLTKFYGKTKALSDAKLSVKTGEILGFIGPNGAGKTTLIRILMGLLKQTKGTILIENEPVLLDDKQNKKIGYLPSESNFFPEFKVNQILKFYVGLNKLKMADAIELAHYFELDLDKKVRDLSYGNKKKLGIVVALMKKAPLLVLDEPTTGLDPLMQKKFLNYLLSEKKRGVTIFLSSHVLSDIQKVCDRVCLIKDGHILFEDDLLTLKQKAYKIITIKPAYQIKLDGLSVVEANEQMVMHYKGEIQPLLKKLSIYPIEELSIESVKLEDIFMQYYEKEKKDDI